MTTIWSISAADHAAQLSSIEPTFGFAFLKTYFLACIRKSINTLPLQNPHASRYVVGTAVTTKSRSPVQNVHSEMHIYYILSAVKSKSPNKSLVRSSHLTGNRDSTESSRPARSVEDTTEAKSKSLALPQFKRCMGSSTLPCEVHEYTVSGAVKLPCTVKWKRPSRYNCN